MSLVKYSVPSLGDARYEPPYSSSTAPPYGQPSTDGSSSSSTAIVIPGYPSSTPSTSYYADRTATTSSTSYTPYPTTTTTSTVYDFAVTSSSNPSPPSTTRNGPAAVSESTVFGISYPNSYLSTGLSSLTPFLTGSTAPAQASNITSTNRTALIAALTAGLSALLLLLLLAFLLYRRRRRRGERLEPTIDSRALPHSALLHDDEMAHNPHLRMFPAPMAQYENSAASRDPAAAIYRPASPSLSILRTRISESGSIFREEVWPPPSPTIDPIQMRSSQVDLSRIVDDVMGPAHNQNTGDPLSDPGKGHRRELTATSTTPLLVEGLSSLGHGSSEEDLTHAHSPLYSPHSLPIVDQPDGQTYGQVPEMYAPVMQKTLSQSSHTSVSSSVYSRHGTAGPSSIIQSPSSFRPPSIGSIQGSIASSTTHQQRTQPKISSPLVRALTGFGVGR